MPEDNKPSDDLDTLLGQLKSSQSIKSMIKAQEETNGLSEEDVLQFVIKYTAKVIKDSTEAVTDLKDRAVAGGDAEDVASLASLIQASMGAISELNKIAMQNKKAKTSKEIVQMQIDARKEVPQIQQQNNFFIASREEVFKKVMSKSESLPEKEITDI